MNIWLVYIPGTDEEPIIENVANTEGLFSRVKQLDLTTQDYAVFNGHCLKQFDGKQ